MNMGSRKAVSVQVVTLLLALIASAAHAQDVRVDGTVVGIGGRMSGVSRPFRLIVNKLTGPGEAAELTQTLGSGGDDALVRALSRMNSGRITVGNGVGLRANAVIADHWGNGGTKLTVFYERNVSF